MKFSPTATLKVLIIFTIKLHYITGVSVGSSLETHLNKHGTGHVMIILKEEIKPVVNSINSRRFSSANVKAATLVHELREFTESSQQNVLSFLGRREPVGNVKPFWITNKISVRNATMQLIKELVAGHGDDIAEIREAITITLDDPISETASSIPESFPDNMAETKPEQNPPPRPENMPESVTDDLSSARPEQVPQHIFGPKPNPNDRHEAPEHIAVPYPGPKTATTGSWGIENINVAEAHKAGFMGQGIVVAIMDSGVRGDHEILKHNIRPTYNWFDAQNHTLKPFDRIGHGTHCAGTAVGRNGMGVSPGSQLVACRIFDRKDAPEDVILTCAQWITCPSLPNGTHEDCSMRPHVTSNSWGGKHSDFFNDPLLTWNAVGIIPVFAIGNTGPACRTAASPGDQDLVISVGASNAFNIACDFSSRGPSSHIGNAKQKPDVCAPGKRIMSASHKGHDKYVVYTGTSMAAPHVAGTVALLLSKRPTTTFHEIMDALQTTALKSTALKPSPNYSCTEGLLNTTLQFPNNLLGAGVIRADAALEYISPFPDRTV